MSAELIIAALLARLGGSVTLTQEEMCDAGRFVLVREDDPHRNEVTLRLEREPYVTVDYAECDRLMGEGQDPTTALLDSIIDEQERAHAYLVWNAMGWGALGPHTPHALALLERLVNKLNAEAKQAAFVGPALPARVETEVIREHYPCSDTCPCNHRKAVYVNPGLTEDGRWVLVDLVDDPQPERYEVAGRIITPAAFEAAVRESQDEVAAEMGLELDTPLSLESLEPRLEQWLDEYGAALREAQQAFRSRGILGPLPSPEPQPEPEPRPYDDWERP